MDDTENKKGEKLLSVIEHLLRDEDEIIADVEKRKGQNPELERDELAEQIVASFSNLSAISGGAAALPAIIPGWGTLTTIVGGALLDTALLLKFEVEMALSLCWLYGYDIREKHERQMAFLLASITTYNVKSDGNFILDVVQAEGVAIWNYAPRQVSKLLLFVLGRLALMGAGKSLLRALPIVGVAIGSGVNKVLTTNVGKHCLDHLDKRILDTQKIEFEDDNSEEIVEAVWTEREQDE